MVPAVPGDAGTPEIMSALRLYRLDLVPPILSARRNEIYHAQRDRKADMGNVVSWADIERIPDIIERPKAVSSTSKRETGWSTHSSPRTGAEG